MQPFDEDSWINRVDQLSIEHYLVIDDLFDHQTLDELLKLIQIREEEDLFKKAAIGSLSKERIDTEIRSDRIFWLDEDSQNESVQTFFGVMGHIRQLLNRYCFLSLSDSEFHLSHYPPGSFYKRHLDQFQGRNNRIISCVLYLNRHWAPDNGGQLLLYTENGIADIQPVFGRLVLFKSAELEHEVITTQKDRYSLTGWMLHRPKGLELL